MIEIHPSENKRTALRKIVSPIELILSLSVLFTILLLIARIEYTHDWSYRFYAWNLFLATIPLLCTRLLYKQQYGFKAFALIACWLLFFPNAPYVITDIFHFEQRPPVPQWYDLVLVFSAAWSGMLLGVVSLLQVESFLSLHWRKRYVRGFVFLSLILCGFGIYLGRVLRFNSWDIVANPQELFMAMLSRFIHPFAHTGAWAFTVLFAAMFGMVYYSCRYIGRSV
ncbi:MAG: DUF1361 domain-containing protein [Filimonas sp.]|nr:DUF1361 domain-containing protein [Filimonas sp.]